jgi:hypothetical protein
MPVPFDARVLCEKVAARRGRPIRLVPMDGLTGVCGLWVATATTDLIFYEQVTTPPHQEHIILHELSHVLCDHHHSSAALGSQVDELLPNLDPAMVHRVLGRAGYSSEEEREAELLASLIRERARSHGGATVTDRLHAALEDDGDG